MPRRKKRSVQERIEAHERELLELRDQARIEELEAALKRGDIVNGKRSEFSSQLRELRLIKKAIRAAERHEQEHLVEPLKEFQEKLTKSMTDLVEEGSPSQV